MNVYDNSIVETDAFLAQTIAWLRTQERDFAPAMLYVGDHGESLGENGLYLHGSALPHCPPGAKTRALGAVARPAAAAHRLE